MFLNNNFFEKWLSNMVNSNYKFLIDNGHGGMIDGEYVTAPNKMYTHEDGMTIYEGVFNREITSLIHEKALNHNLDTELIVPEEKDISLGERVRRVQEAYSKTKKQVIFISVHGNAYPPDKSAEGWEVYTHPIQSKADDVATLLFKEAKKEFISNFKMRTDYSDGDPDKESKFYVLRKTTVPAILTENFFMSNYDDCEFMLSDEGKERIAHIHFNVMRKIEDENLI